MDIDLKKCNAPFLVHSDIFRTAHLIRKGLINNPKRKHILHAHISYLENYFGSENLIFPAFNYDFAKLKVFDVTNSESHAGVLTNYVLHLDDYNRTNTPIFSFAVNKKLNSLYSNTPYGKESVFDKLFNENGTIILYGAGIDSCTYLHYVESQYGPPRYRYDKTFTGMLLAEGNYSESQVSFHARPMGIELVYDWNGLEQTLIDSGTVIPLELNIFAVKARDISKLWGERISDDDLSVLSDECRPDIERRLMALGRRFVISDFEGDN